MQMTTLMAEGEEDLKSLLMKVKEQSEKLRSWHLVPSLSWQIDGETMEPLTVYFLGFQNHCRWTVAMKLKDI